MSENDLPLESDLQSKREAWLANHQHTPEQLAVGREALTAVRDGLAVTDALRQYRLPQGGYLPKRLLVAAYRDLVKRGEWDADPSLLARIRLKPVRTLSGVTTVTVLTKPYPCRGGLHLLPD